MSASAALLALACLAAGAAAGWLARGRWRGSSPESPDGSSAAPFVVEAVIRIPTMLFGAPIYGLGLEVSGLLVSDAADAPGDGIDPATGLGYGPPESEQ